VCGEQRRVEPDAHWGTPGQWSSVGLFEKCSLLVQFYVGAINRLWAACLKSIEKGGICLLTEWNTIYRLQKIWHSWKRWYYLSAFWYLFRWCDGVYSQFLMTLLFLMCIVGQYMLPSMCAHCPWSAFLHTGKVRVLVIALLTTRPAALLQSQEVAADWHELMIPWRDAAIHCPRRRTIGPAVKHTHSRVLHGWCAHRHTTAPIIALGLHPVARELLPSRWG